MTERRPTIEEVARRAGVSRGTASRVVNNEPHVSGSAREKVERAVKDLGYVPNRAARSLVTRRREAVAIAVSSTDPQVFDYGFFAEVLLGVNSVLDETDLELILALGGTDRGRERLRRQLSAQRVDGVVLMAVRGSDPLPELVARSGVPAVFCGRPLGSPPTLFVDADNRGGARLAAEHLIGLGRRRIATITGPQDMDVGVARFEGFRDALRPSGLEAHVAHGDFQETGGAHGMAALLDLTPDLDAVFAASDSMAVGALRVLRARGRRVPEDVAVVGFDDLPASRTSDPALTTVRQPMAELGTEAARTLLALMAGRSPTSLVLPTELVVRQSA